VGELVSTARRLWARALLADHLAAGSSVERALLATVQALLDVDELDVARRLVGGADGLGSRAQSLARVVLAHDQQLWTSALAALATLTDEDVARYVPVPAVEACLAEGAQVERARRIAACSALMATSDVVALAVRFLALADRETAEDLARTARARSDWDARSLRRMEVLESWLHPATPPAAPSGVARLGVIDYRSVDDAGSSFNVGDYVQTLAMLGHVARFVDCTVSGDEELVDAVRELHGRVRPDLRVPGSGGSLHLVPVSRDSSSLEQHEAPTWLVAFGWHLHPLFGLRHDFPYHEALRPLFVSFYLHDPVVLTPAVLDYLRRRGPVGCRDWTTVDLLLSAGVDAFFTGCLTSTLDGIFPAPPEVRPDAPVGLVDVPRRQAGVDGPVVVIKHQRLQYRRASLGEGLRAASELLDRYQQEYASVVTSRLHAYLPATTLGVPVRFRPRNRSDTRFDGLLGLRPGSPELHEMRDGIRALLRDVLALLVQGASEDVVRARWGELTAPRVAAARARLAASVELPTPPRQELTAELAEVRAGRVLAGPHHETPPDGVTDVVVPLGGEQAHRVGVTLEALTSNASGAVRVWFVSNDIDAEQRRRVTEAFPELATTFMPCDEALGLLALAELLPEVSRAVVLDGDVLVVGDVGDLAGTDLAGRPFAARPSSELAARVWRQAGLLLPPRRAFELRRTMAARHPFGARSFDPGVLVVDLERLRADRVAETWQPFASRHALTGAQTLLAYAGADRADLDPRWNVNPEVEPVVDPLAVRYGRPGTAWSDGPGAAGALWRDYADALRRRTGA
jgi:hypothetical protein